MRKEAKTLHMKAADSLVLAVDHFNRVWDRGRIEAVLILLDRAFELLLKAIIVHRGGDIRDKAKEGTTIGFDLCLRKCLSDIKLKCLTEDDVVALQAMNTLRDAAQHHMKFPKSTSTFTHKVRSRCSSVWATRYYKGPSVTKYHNASFRCVPSLQLT